jgi:gliding motility-associated-like protein
VTRLKLIFLKLLTVRNLFISSILSLCFQTIGQTLIINEFSNGPSGSQEYVELVVVDTSSGNSNCSNCIDLRGWIIDDNNGFHGSSGIASGCNRFSNDVFWSCIPLGTSITVYNGTDPNIDLPVNDLDINDGNCNLVLPIENSTLFETNPNTPGAIVCDYPNLGWNPGGIWSRIGMRNGGDCIRLVDLTGCEVFSLSYGDISLNSTIYFPGSGTDDVFYFSGTNPYLQADWTQGCAGDPGACLGNDQSPGAANSNLNSDYIDQFTVNGCLPSIPISLILTNQSNSCGDCTGSITLNAAQGQGLYTFNISPAVPITSNPSTSPISVDNICSGEYIATVIDENGCEDAQNFEIENDDPPTITTPNNVSVCNGGSIELNAILGGSANAISWVSPNGTFSNINSTTTTFTPSINSAIAFVVVTAESENCGTTQENIFVNVSSPIEPIFSQLPAQCEGAAFSLNTTSANGISGTWSPAIDNLATTSYTFTPNIGECATIQNMTVVVNTTSSSISNLTICDNDLPFIWNGLTFSENGTQSTTLTSNNTGCDSTVTLNLSVNPTFSIIEELTICQSELPYLWNGITFANSGSQTASLFTANGCDSIVTLNLTVISEFTSLETHIGCMGDGYSVDVNGTIYDEANPTGTETVTAVAGCDSIVSINLIFNSVLPGTDVQSACDSYTWIDGNTYNSSNNDAMWVIPSVSGCDSIITLELTITNSNTGTDIKSACDTYTWIDGNTYTTSNNNATWVLTNIEGCDSLVTLDLTINDSPTLIDFSNGGTYCEGESVLSLTAEVSGVPDFTLDYTLNGNPLSISSNNSSIDLGNLSGVYTLNALNDNYCTTSLNESQTIVINPIPDAPSIGEDENYCSNAVPEAIQPEGGSGSYNWYFDASLTQLLATANEYTPSLILGSSTYYVTAIENNCEGLPGEISITFADCQIIIPTAFTPDDDQANDKWMLGNIDNLFPKNVVSIYNRWGNKLFESREGIYSANPWNGTYNNEKLPIASYYYIIEFNDGKTAPINGIVSIVK